jgi:hypothetical protein
MTTSQRSRIQRWQTAAASVQIQSIIVQFTPFGASVVCAGSDFDCYFDLSFQYQTGMPHAQRAALTVDVKKYMMEVEPEDDIRPKQCIETSQSCADEGACADGTMRSQALPIALMPRSKSPQS